MSRADFYVLASIVAIEEGIKNANEGDPEVPMPSVAIPFKLGRTDCDTSPTTDRMLFFPDGREDFNELHDFFRDEFKLNVVDTVALMGAHTLGGCTGISGYSGFK